MVTKRINRSDLIDALIAHSEELADYNFVPFLGEFFGDGPEWEGIVRKSIKQKLSHQDLEVRLADAKTKNLELTKTIEGMKNDSADYLKLANSATQARKSQIEAFDALRAANALLMADNLALKSRFTLPEGITVIPVA